MDVPHLFQALNATGYDQAVVGGTRRVGIIAGIRPRMAWRTDRGVHRDGPTAPPKWKAVEVR